jgi:hypothetical protein
MAEELTAHNREEAGEYLAGVVERLVAQGVRARARLLVSRRLVPSLLRLTTNASTSRSSPRTGARATLTSARPTPRRVPVVDDMLAARLQRLITAIRLSDRGGRWTLALSGAGFFVVARSTWQPPSRE